MKEETIFKRRQEVFEAALNIFSKKGFYKATLDEIADKVKVSKPALYLYFKNKETLFFSMIENKMSGLGEKFHEIIKTDMPSIEKLKNVISSNIDFYRNNLEFFKIIHQMRFQLDDKKQSALQKKFIKNYGDYVHELEQLIKQCMEDSYLKKQDSYFLTLVLMGMMNQCVFGCIIMANRPSYLENVDKDIFEFFLQGAGK